MFFKPFVNDRTREGFLDGAVFHNNPVRIANYESKLIWPDAEERHPDILLSIGTGHNGADSEGYVDDNYSDNRRLPIRRVFSQVRSGVNPTRPAHTLRAFPQFKDWFKIFKTRMESVLDAEQTWREFRKDVVGTSSPIQEKRYIRINPKTSIRTPKLDDKAKVSVLQDDVKARLKSHGMRMKIEKVAQRLVASSFYFDKMGSARVAGDQITIQGEMGTVLHVRFFGLQRPALQITSNVCQIITTSLNGRGC
jgi:hypothetical protein